MNIRLRVESNPPLPWVYNNFIENGIVYATQSWTVRCGQVPGNPEGSCAAKLDSCTWPACLTDMHAAKQQR
jgi:hypothetical protein